MRKDGKTKIGLLLMAIFFGLFGGEYFYVKRKKMAWTKLLISWVAATIIIIALIVWATNDIASSYETWTIDGLATKAGKAYEETLAKTMPRLEKEKLVEAFIKAHKLTKDVIDAGAAAKPIGEYWYWVSIVIVTSISGVILSGNLVWSLINAFQISSGSFVDEFNKPVSSWKATKEEFAEYLLGEV